MAAQSEYVLDGPNELKRLTYQHEILRDAMPDDQLLIVPIDVNGPPLRVLDSATADGTWLRDVEQSLPKGSTLVGINSVENFFPPSGERGPNLTLQAQDINKPWPESWAGSFDIVHQRFALATAGAGVQAALNNLGVLVKPGGYIQLVEPELYDPHPRNGLAAEQYFGLMRSKFGMLGAPSSMARDMVRWVREAGFQDVQEHRAVARFGASNASEVLAEKALFSTGVEVTSLIQMAKTTQGIELETEISELDTLVPRLAAELREHGLYLPLVIVTGRKPA